MDAYNVLVTPSADRDLDEIFEYVAVRLNAPLTADKLVLRLFNAMSALSFSPWRCPLSKDPYLAKQGFRNLFAESYIIFFVVDDNAKNVIIHRVIYAKRNYVNLL